VSSMARSVRHEAVPGPLARHQVRVLTARRETRPRRSAVGYAITRTERLPLVDSHHEPNEDPPVSLRRMPRSGIKACRWWQPRLRGQLETTEKTTGAAMTPRPHPRGARVASEYGFGGGGLAKPGRWGHHQPSHLRSPQEARRPPSPLINREDTRSPSPRPPAKSPRPPMPTVS